MVYVKNIYLLFKKDMIDFGLKIKDDRKGKRI